MSILISTSLSGNSEFGPGELRVLLRSVGVRVWLVVLVGRILGNESGSSVSLIVSNSSSVRAVNWELVVVLSKSVSVGIWI